METFGFYIPTRVIFGDGTTDQLGQALGETLGDGYDRVLIVTEEVAYEASGARDRLTGQLGNRKVELFTGVVENPPLETLEAGRAVARELGAQLIIGVGGGSAMDTAKGLAVLATNDGTMSEYLGGKALTSDPIPIVCLPTTSGTGSEVTPFAVFTCEQNKAGYANFKIFPKLSIVDPQLTFSMPEALVVDTGLDVITHGIEAYLSADAFHLNDLLAMDAVEVAVQNLKAAASKDRAAMSRMAYASMAAGMSITGAGTILLHIMGYPLTFFHGIPHGRANGILLPVFLDFMRRRSTVEPKVRRLDGLFAAHGGVRGFIEALGVSTCIGDHGVVREELDRYAEMTIVKGDVKITPAQVGPEDIRGIYEASMDQQDPACQKTMPRDRFTVVT